MFYCNFSFNNTFQTVAAASVNFGGSENCFGVKKMSICASEKEPVVRGYLKNVNGAIQQREGEKIGY